jgi:chemotaxis protein CheX
MMMGMPVDELDEMSQSALSELANMLTASAATAFYNLGIHIDISTPTLLYGKNISVNMSSKQVLCIQLLADGHAIDINIAFESK